MHMLGSIQWFNMPRFRLKMLLLSWQPYPGTMTHHTFHRANAPAVPRDWFPVAGTSLTNHHHHHTTTTMHGAAPVIRPVYAGHAQVAINNSFPLSFSKHLPTGCGDSIGSVSGRAIGTTMAHSQMDLSSLKVPSNNRNEKEPGVRRHSTDTPSDEPAGANPKSVLRISQNQKSFSMHLPGIWNAYYGMEIHVQSQCLLLIIAVLQCDSIILSESDRCFLCTVKSIYVAWHVIDANSSLVTYWLVQFERWLSEHIYHS